MATGFQVRTAGPKTGYWNYADIDDDFISIHHYIKWYKFGCTRLFDNLSIEIRNGRLTRNEALEIVRTLERKQAPQLPDVAIGNRYYQDAEKTIQAAATVMTTL